ncbi:N5-glutamine methyltransferase family protein [Paenibacillus agricola]|uniref:Release factor glutamine methyltransferase n=1 Tax=Paenibacillus agricola TaxID=2716264 RepID=A0ABX0JEZ4_9BACL|nr:HemK/PrmC family methyltransferase [Paenibacillus agricola]NHN33796.1 peptide chain release factor N(5)-glutamine methyltransferase [Paenibacillus agricola]
MVALQKLTIREAYVEASSFFREHGASEAEGSADLLLQHLLGLSRSELLLSWQEPFPEERNAKWRELLERRAAGEPVQYIIGEQEFYGLPFTVTPAVLIPRPETELLVEQIVLLGKQLWPEACGEGAKARRGVEARGTETRGAEARSTGAGVRGVEVSGLAEEVEQHAERGGLDGNEAEAKQRLEPATAGRSRLLVADIGAGSGAIAVSLAVQCPQWRVVGSDISSTALAVAQANAKRHAVDGQVTFMEGDLLMPYIQRGLRLDVVVSNPPYIPEADEAGLQIEVRHYEPRSALYGGVDGLDLYRRLMEQLAMLEVLPSLVGLEVGFGQAGEVAQLLRQAGAWDEIRIVPDLAGIPRHVIGIRFPVSATC